MVSRDFEGSALLELLLLSLRRNCRAIVGIVDVVPLIDEGRVSIGGLNEGGGDGSCGIGGAGLGSCLGSLGTTGVRALAIGSGSGSTPWETFPRLVSPDEVNGPDLRPEAFVSRGVAVSGRR